MSEVQQLLDLTDDTPPPIALYPYQEAALAAIHRARAAGVTRQLLVLPTGAGKTVVFSHLIKEMQGRALVLAHRDELIEQAFNKLRRVLDAGVSIGVVKAERNEINAQVLVGSIQTVSGERRLRQMPDDLELVVVDEAHHAVAETYERTLKSLGCMSADGPLLLGVTATPDRGDKREIGRRIFEAPVFQMSMRDLINDGYLCEVVAKRVSVPLDLSAVKTNHGDFDQDDLENALEDAGAVEAIVRAYLAHGEGRKTLAFLPGVRLAHALAAAARAAGIPAEALDGATPHLTRRAMLERFAAGTTRLLANCMVLTEGYDEPSIECLVLCRPTKSRPLFVQMLGRGMRVFPGKRNLLALDVTGVGDDHDVVTIPDVFPTPQDPHDDDTTNVEVYAGGDGKPAGTRDPELHLLTGADSAVEQDILAAQALVAKLKNLHLVPVYGGQTEYAALHLGDGLLKVGPHPKGGFCVVYNGAGSAPQLLHRGKDAQDALTYAYGYAYQFGKPWAYKAGLRWRSKPASAKSVGTLRRLGMLVPEPATAGAVQDAFTVYHALHGFH